jgi:hypothetical protein
MSEAGGIQHTVGHHLLLSDPAVNTLPRVQHLGARLALAFKGCASGFVLGHRWSVLLCGLLLLVRWTGADALKRDQN